MLRRHGDSQYADDALLLMGRSFQRLGRYADAAATYERLVARFPDSELVPRARLGLVRAWRMAGDGDAARVALDRLADLSELPEGVDEREILHERILIALAAEDHVAAVAAFEEMNDRFPGYVRGEDVALRIADAQLAIGDVEAALDAYSTYLRTAPSPVARRTAGFRLARAVAERDRGEEALGLYDRLLDEASSDSISAHVRLERGVLRKEMGRTDEAMEDLRAVRELLPGSALASRAILHAGRILWHTEKRREEALDDFLDAFLHAPGSAYADSARTAARGVSEVLHFRDLVEGDAVVADRAATARYRLAEEILSRESDPAAAIEVFVEVVERHPDSPWASRAMLAIGVLEGRRGRDAESRRWLERLVAEHPETPVADSARRELGLPVPERVAGFYSTPPDLVELLDSLPPIRDPMITVADQLDRYADRRAARASVTRAVSGRPPGAAAGDRTGDPAPAGQRPGAGALPEGQTPTP